MNARDKADMTRLRRYSKNVLIAYIIGTRLFEIHWKSLDALQVSARLEERDRLFRRLKRLRKRLTPTRCQRLDTGRYTRLDADIALKAKRALSRIESLDRSLAPVLANCQENEE